MSESEKKPKTEDKPKNVMDEEAQKKIKREADKKTEEQIASVRLPDATKSYDEYVQDLRAGNLAMAAERERFHKKLGIMNFHTFGQNTADIEDPFSIPEYSESVRLEYHDPPMHHWAHFQKLKAEVEDIERLSRTMLQSFADTKTPVPPDWESLRDKKVKKDLELYYYGFFIFFRGTLKQFNRCDFIYLRDRVDAAEYRTVNSLPFSQNDSSDSSTSNPMASASIA